MSIMLDFEFILLEYALNQLYKFPLEQMYLLFWVKVIIWAYVLCFFMQLSREYYINYLSHNLFVLCNFYFSWSIIFFPPLLVDVNNVKLCVVYYSLTPFLFAPYSTLWFPFEIVLYFFFIIFLKEDIDCFIL